MIDDIPVPKPVIPLDQLSIEELQELIVDLKDQIRVAEEMIASKQNAAAAAQSFFKS